MPEPMDDPARMRPLGPPGVRHLPDGHGRTFYVRRPGVARELYVEQQPHLTPGEGEWGVVELKWYRDHRGEKDFTTFWIDARRFTSQDGAETYLEVVQIEDDKQLAQERAALGESKT